MWYFLSERNKVKKTADNNLILPLFFFLVKEYCMGVCLLAKLLQLCLSLCDPMNCSLQAPLCMAFFRQEYWSPWHFLLQGIFLIQGSNVCLLGLLHLQAGSLPLVPPGKSETTWNSLHCYLSFFSGERDKAVGVRKSFYPITVSFHSPSSAGVHDLCN